MRYAFSSGLWGDDNCVYLKHLPTFFSALNDQNDKNFDIVYYVSKNLAPKLRESFEKHAPQLNSEQLIIKTLTGELDNLTVAAQRLEYFYEKNSSNEEYAGIFMVDVDDTIPSNYTEAMIATMSQHKADIVTADMRLCFSDERVSREKYLSTRLLDNINSTSRKIKFEDILHCNFNGFSNTLVRPDIFLDTNFQDLQVVPKSIEPALDWFIFMRALGQDKRIVFTSDTHINYLQNGSNLSDILNLSRESIQKAHRLKADFYGCVIQENWKNKYKALIANLENQYNSILNEGEVSLDKHLRKCITANEELQSPFWWEGARVPSF